jgi:hypothetical protein
VKTSRRSGTDFDEAARGEPVAADVHAEHAAGTQLDLTRHALPSEPAARVGEEAEHGRRGRGDAPLDHDRRGGVSHWHCVGGPPPWIDTDILFQIGAAPEGGTRVLFDHVGWKDAEEMVRIVTFGWVQMFQRLKAYAESGEPQPYFDF